MSSAERHHGCFSSSRCRRRARRRACASGARSRRRLRRLARRRLPAAWRRGAGQALRELGDECVREGGSAWLMTVMPSSGDDDAAYRQLFDRSGDYAELAQDLEGREPRACVASADRAHAPAAAAAARVRRRLRRSTSFRRRPRVEAEAAWLGLRASASTRLLSPDEPHESRGAMPRLDAARLPGPRLGDPSPPLGRPGGQRLADPPLHRPGRKFRWLAKPADCPKSALGFDFDGATFTHVGDRVTFETLMASFGLDEDPALARLAALVHALDVGGEPVARGAGFEAVMAGARERIADDDALLAEMSAVSTRSTPISARSQRATKRATDASHRHAIPAEGDPDGPCPPNPWLQRRPACEGLSERLDREPPHEQLQRRRHSG